MMGTWSQIATLTDPTNSSRSIGHCCPIPDGRLMVTDFNGAHGFLAPDLTGNYTQWSGWTENAYSQLGAPLMVMNDGRCVILGGHQNQTGELVIKVVEPSSNAVSYVTGVNGISHQGRGAWHYLDDGRIVATRGSVGEVFLNPDLTTTVGTAVCESTEADLTLIPDGRLLGFTFWPNAISRRAAMYSPSYSQSYVVSGSYPGNGTRTLFEPSVAWAPGTQNTEWMYQTLGVGFGPVWAGEEVLGVGEIGGQIYMPAVDKVVVVGGWGGEIFGIDPALVALSGQATVLANTPHDTWTASDNRSAGYRPFSLSPVHNGQTPAQIVAGGTLNVVVKQAFSPPLANQLCVQTVDGWCIIRGTANTANTSLSAGATIQMTGLSLYKGRHLSQVVNGSDVYHTNPNRRSVESWIAILPSGRLAYPAGYGGGNGGESYGTDCDMYLWNGIDATSSKEIIPGGLTARSGWTTHGCIAPNGNLILASGTTVWQYTEDVAPNGDYAPAIASVPTQLQQGSQYTLFGTQLSGRHIGFIHGDDFGGHSNIGLVKLVRGNGNTYWARTSDWTYRGIQANRGSSMRFQVPFNIPPDNYMLHAVTCGQSSAGVPVTVASSLAGESTFLGRF